MYIFNLRENVGTLLAWEVYRVNQLEYEKKVLANARCKKYSQVLPEISSRGVQRGLVLYRGASTWTLAPEDVELRPETHLQGGHSAPLSATPGALCTEQG